MKESLLSHLFAEDLYYFTTPVVVVLPRPWETYDPEAQTLLQKILNSVRIDINTVQLVVQDSLNLGALSIYSPARVLIFGHPEAEGVPLYAETQAQGFTVIGAHDLNQLDDQKKKNLWTGLRRMFGI